MADISARMLDTSSKNSALCFAFGALAMLACIIEVIIALKFNLQKYPTIPLGFVDLTWARALTLISFGLFARAAWKYSLEDVTAKRTVVFASTAMLIALLDAIIGFNFFPPPPGEGQTPLDQSILRIGNFSIRVIPTLCLAFAFLGLVSMQKIDPKNRTDRWTLIAGLTMGLVGMVSVLPALPYSAIGVGEYNVRELLGDVNRVFKGSFRIGPASPTENYYALMFMLAALITVVSIGRSDEDVDAIRQTGVMRYVDWGAFILLGYACFQYLYVGVEAMSFTIADANAALIGCLCVLYLCYRVYGAALALCGGGVLLYFFTSNYIPGVFGAEYSGYVSLAENLWFNNSKAVLGSKLGILLNNVLPFILFGALLSATGAAKSLITLAFYLMRNTRGGPAHAAVMASGLFGSVSGSAVSNVVGTGVITIPMIKKRGYTPEFAGGVEATASTGGQIMPPIMGAAALVMADLTGTAYLNIMIAALIPAIAYYLSLFATVMFESRRMDMKVQSLEDLDPVTRQDYVNVILLVFIPLLVVIWRLIDGASPAGSALTAILVVFALSAFSPVVRNNPVVLVRSIANGGITFGRLLMVVGVVGIIVAVMNTTDLPSKLGREIADFASIALVLTLVITALVSLLLGMGMPTLPAYLTVIIILGPALSSLGLSVMTSHMFVFYFGVASAITPPVAVAAFAAAAIAGAKPIATGVAAVRIGIVIFAVPFMFALNPDMMIVSEAFPDPINEGFSAVEFVSVVARTAFMIYLLASATSRFDRAKMPMWESVVRFVSAIFLIAPSPEIHLVSASIGMAVIGYHYFISGSKAQTA